MSDTTSDAPQEITASTGMLIRRPAEEVYAAFADPNVTTRFWFTRGSGPLTTGATVTWHWDMYNAQAAVHVVEATPGERLHVRWGDADDEQSMTDIVWTFCPRDGGQSTFVSVTNSGFHGTPEEICSQARDSTEGFALALAGAKAWLEHGIELGLTGDRFPSAE